jgi:hypothetical protein
VTTPPTPAEIEQVVKILREDALLEGNRALAKRMTNIEERLKRMPVTEMSAEEKAAEYDKLMAERHKKTDPPAEPPKDPKAPVPPAPKAPEPPAPKRDPYWGDRLNG